MKQKTFFLFLFTVTSMIYSCKKEKEKEPEPIISTQSVSDYFPMTSGSYWVYKQSEYDTSGNLLNRNWNNDSIVVKNDTVINSKTYHTLVHYNSWGYSSYLKDSADCIVDQHGRIAFSIHTSGLVYHEIITPDTLAYVNYYCNGTPADVTVPMGTFSCLDYRGEVFIKDNFNKAYFIHRYHCKKIGIVKRIDMFLGSLTQIHADLVSYHIQ